ERQKRRCVHDARDGERIGGREDMTKTADVDLIEIFAPAPPDADEGGRVRDRIASRGRVLQGRAVANVAVDRRSRQSAARRRAREYDGAMPARRECANDGATEIPGAASDEHLHDGWLRQ